MRDLCSDLDFSRRGGGKSFVGLDTFVERTHMIVCRVVPASCCNGRLEAGEICVSTAGALVEIGVCGVLAFTGGEDSGYKFGNERAGCRETGANDGDIAFDCRPSGCAWVVVCELLASSSSIVHRIARLDSHVESFESEITRRLCRRRILVTRTL